MSRVLVYPNGFIYQGIQGVTFECDPRIYIKIKVKTLDELKQYIHLKLKLKANKVVSQLIYRIPTCVNPLRYNSLLLSEDEDVKVMTDCYKQFRKILTCMEVYAKIETIDINLNEQVQRVEDCRTFTIFPSNHETEVNVRGNDVELSSLQDILDDLWVNDIEDVVGDEGNDSDSGSDNGNDNSTHLASSISHYNPSSFYLSQINIQAMNKLKIPGLVQESSWNEDSNIFTDLLFTNKDSLMLALKLFSFKRHKNYKIVSSTTKEVHAKCTNFGNGCHWWMKACPSSVFKGWQITYHGGHNCISLSISQNRLKLDSDIVAGCIVDMVKEFPDVSISQVVQRIKDKFSCNVSYRNAWIGKQKAIAMVYGNWEASYDFLRHWMAAVQLYMPGTVVEFQTRQHGAVMEYFQGVFWAYKPCIDAFEHLKPMIQIDRISLYGKYRDTMLIAIAQDGNRDIVPIAFAIVDGETLDTWSWFLGLLRRHIVNERSGICLISVNHPSILTAISNECLGWQPPSVHHVFCIRYLAYYLKNYDKTEMLKKLFVSIGYQYQQHLVDQKMRTLCKLNKEAANWIDKIPREKWCLAYDVDGRRYGHMTTNVAECMNNVLKGIRSLPITSLVQATMYKLATHFVNRSTKAVAQLQNGQLYCEYLRNALQTNQSKASAYIVRSYNMEEMLFEVHEPYNQHHQQFGRVCKVLLNRRQCDCGEFQALRYPCSHVIAACAFASQDYQLYIDPIYRLDTIVNAYSSTFPPIGGEELWPSISEPKLVPCRTNLRKPGSIS